MGGPAYPYPIPAIVDGNKAYSDGIAPTRSKIYGCHHLSTINGSIHWPAGITAGKVIVDIVPTFDYPDTAESDIQIAVSDVVADGIAGPFVVPFTFPGNASYVRHRVVTDCAGGLVDTYHNGYSN